MYDKKIIDMDNKEALKFLLKSDSYCNLKLPKYFDFSPLLEKIHKDNPNKSLQNFYKDKDNAKYYKNINYNIYISKSGSLSWRKITLINPIAYVGIVQEMCRKENWELLIARFEEFKKFSSRIKCCSIPVMSLTNTKDKREQILNWWSEFEQKTISESLNYKYMIMTDISNFYPSIYTHSIPWALHGKEEIKDLVKKGKSGKLYGEKLDIALQAISYGQTNGIPQGSILSDFIAELVLGYCDQQLYEELKKDRIINYKIIRYRDDYRIFSNDSEEIDRIFKKLVIILNDLNLQINNSKTCKTDDILSKALKPDKVYGLLNHIDSDLNTQKKIFAINEVGKMYKNSGLLIKLLHSFYKDELLKLKNNPHDIEEITGIVVDIINNNSKVYPECIAILSKILSFSAKSTKLQYIERIKNKITKDFNREYVEIWLQRLSITGDIELTYNTPLCEKVYKTNVIWDSSWSRYIIDESMIINRVELNRMEEIVTNEEIDDFLPIAY